MKTEFKCGATVSGGVNAGMGATVTTEESDCVDCEQCIALNGNVGATLGGSADCYVGFEIYRYKRKIGCDGCANVSASPYFGAQLQEGECGDQGCAYVGVNAQATAGLSTTIGYGWFSVRVGCSARVTGCAEASTCGSCQQCNGCGNVNTSFSCRVN